MAHPQSEMFRHKRAEIRIRVDADAIYTIGRRETRGRVRNLSAGGIEITKRRPVPDVGTRASIVVIGENARLGPLEGEVVRATETGVAFRFLGVDAQVRAKIIQAIQAL